MSKRPRIWLSPPHMGGEELRFVEDAFRSNWIAPLGPHVDEFEKELAAFTGSKACAAVSSGTAAIHLALLLLGIKAGDVVLCSSFTFAASANPIVYCGATPIFVESEPTTWNMSPLYLKEAIVSCLKAGKKPAAIILVHLYGMPALMNEIVPIAESYGIPIIEDAAEALGSTINGRHVGTFGKFGILSFNGNKIITTSGGGAIFSDDISAIEKARFLSQQARDPAPHFEHSTLGYNYRMSNIIAAIGRGQMRVLHERVNRKREIYNYYRSELSSVPGISFLEESPSFQSNRWLTCILIDSSLTGGKTREDVRLALERENIDARPLWKPMHIQPLYEHPEYFGDRFSDKLFRDGLCLPSGTALSPEDLSYITSIVTNTLSA